MRIATCRSRVGHLLSLQRKEASFTVYGIPGIVLLATGELLQSKSSAGTQHKPGEVYGSLISQVEKGLHQYAGNDQLLMKEGEELAAF
ncbi:hypothetical protein AAFF_G00029810 [Aldrovandia affinis]|uniref:Uncharacterized protein n=1 Tax=Aldrovandia affinis TaxID=143900 RepID=A0AAD7WH26_9TELE|nr:hypothetical protein AAFF_G00029810 [Aldrovandia affinis]